MKNKIIVAIISFAIVYVLKKGVESAKESGEKVDIFNAFKRGLKITIDSFLRPEASNENTNGNIPVWENDKPKNYEMASFSNPVNSFHGAVLKNRRGVFHMPTLSKRLN